MRIGIVTERYTRKTRVKLYVLIPLGLIALYLLLSYMAEVFSIAIYLFIPVLIVGFIFLRRIAFSFNLIGLVNISDDCFQFSMNNIEFSVMFKNIDVVMLYPMLGVSQLPETFRTYLCKIKTKDGEIYKFQLTREEVNKGKLISRNMKNPNAFDLIKFMDKHRINYHFGSRIY